MRLKVVVTAATLMASATIAMAEKRYWCTGQVGNGYLTWESGYRTFGSTTPFELRIDCGWLKHLRSACSGSVNGVENKGYKIGSAFHWFDGPLRRSFGIHFNFNTTTHQLTYMLRDGPAGTNQNQTQRWYNGRCNEL